MPSAIAHPQNHLAALAMLVAPSVCDAHLSQSYDKNINRNMGEFVGRPYLHASKENILIVDSSSVMAASSNPARVSMPDEDFWQFWQHSNVSGKESEAPLDGLADVARLIHELVHHGIMRRATGNDDGLSWLNIERVVSVPKTDEEDIRHDYKERIEYLGRVGLDEDIQIDNDSEKEFLAFVSSTATNRRAMLVLLDEGHLRAVWKSDDDQIGLEFLGGGTVNYDVFKERSYGSCSITDAEGMLRHFLENSRDDHGKSASSKG